MNSEEATFGIPCPRCKALRMFVTHTWPKRKGIRRRRRCRDCGKVQYTTETSGGSFSGREQRLNETG
jgi:phage FluMu protein Com